MNNDVPPLEDVPVLLDKIKLQEESNAPKAERDIQVKLPPPKSEVTNAPFAGMKKGFLFQDPKQKPKKKTSQSTPKKSDDDSIPFIKKSSDNSGLVFKEVQEAMKSDPFSQFQDTLSTKIESDSKVSHVLSDPKWLAILDEFQADPQKAMIKYKDNPEVRETMTHLCSIFGDSFLHMESANKSEEEDLSRKMMESPELKDALTDPYIELIMDHMKKGENDKVHRMLQSASNFEREKIKLLVDFGLFSFIS